MISQADLEAVNAFFASDAPVAELARGDGASPLPETRALEAAAAQSAEIAVEFIRQGKRYLGRQHLKRAIEQLNEAEIED